ncbi:MAG: hypothetical protein ACE5I1_16100 [bacterium]
MSVKDKLQKRLEQLFSQQKCRTIDDLCQSLEYSAISVRRFLKQVGYFSSFTHNSRWYTLHSIPIFNKDGLWFYNDIGFSQQGNLKKTILYLIDKSPQGFSATQLSGKLLTPCHAVLHQMYKAEAVDRFKSAKNFVFISIDERKKRRQLKRLQSQDIEIYFPERELSAQAAVYILVEFIKHPQASFAELSRAVRKRQVVAAPEVIARFFEKHGLKKTPRQRN